MTYAEFTAHSRANAIAARCAYVDWLHHLTHTQPTHTYKAQATSWLRAAGYTRKPADVEEARALSRMLFEGILR